MSADAAVTQDLGLPAWLEDMLKPGVGSAVFLTLKLSLVGLVLTLCGLLTYLTDPTIRMHVSIFLGMTVVLLLLVIWFVGELASATAAEHAAKEDEKEVKKVK